MKFFYFLQFFILFTFASLAQSYQIPLDNFLEGTLPPIDYRKLNPDNVEKGFFYIKTNKSLAHNLHNQLTSAKSKVNSTSSKTFNDFLSTKSYHAIKPYFSGSISTPNLKQNHYDLDQWFVLYIDANDDIFSITNNLLAINDILIAEPVFKIVRYIDDSKTYVPKHHDMLENSFSDEFFHISNSTSQEENPTIPNDPEYTRQWHYDQIKLLEAWQFSSGDSNVIVSIHDGGVQYNHPDLQNNIISYVGPDGVNTNPDSHGTHVAGTVAAVNNNNLGVVGIAGGSYPKKGVSLMSLDIFKEGVSNGDTYVWAADRGASVSQNSWGYLEPSVYNQPDLIGIKYFYENGGGSELNGGIVIFAAGNDSSGEDWYPGFYEYTFAVSATDKQDVLASFSNYGSWVDISAPGVSIYSTDINDLYSSKQGSSMACPHVSGVAALLVSRYPGVFTNDSLQRILMLSADNVDTINISLIGLMGAGRLNALAAFELAEDLLSQSPAVISIIPSDRYAQINVDYDRQFMIAYSLSQIIDDPIGIYSIGDTLGVDAYIAYQGEEPSVLINELEPGNTYYFKVWGINEDGSYTYSRRYKIETECGVLPYSYKIDFENTSPLGCWFFEGESQLDKKQWQVGRFLQGLKYNGDSNNYLYINSRAYDESESQDAEVISPLWDISGVSELSVNFNHYYRHHTSSTAELFYSTNSGNSWELAREWKSTTANPQFESISIYNLNSDFIQFKFKYTGQFSYYWCVDDIYFDIPNSIKHENLDNIRVFPNPSSGMFNVLSDNVLIKVRVIDSFGRIIYLIDNINDNMFTFDLKKRGKGFYFIEIHDNNSIHYKKLLIN